MKYSIKSIPTLDMFKNSKIVDQLVGGTPDYESYIKQIIQGTLKE